MMSFESSKKRRDGEGKRLTLPHLDIIQKGGEILGYPNSNIDDALQADFVQDTVNSLMELSNQGIPQNTDELKRRISDYFSFCADRGMRPGIESLSLALSTSRQNFWAWTQGKYKDAEWQEICQQAKQVIISFLEAASLQGRLNPATSIFLLKNWANYADTVTFETGETQQKAVLTASSLPHLSDTDET